ncbi:MAG: hypothetical protein Sylvanvirus7_36 [Sylvanvirus sp.]|uniref:Uncharacterized protein n=1 Tax=Sylvanvirus sp. TaxID=2487774 RepID=A0A3G5AHV2_9VIRU|nr:MAG: hypothetical protein Sylvanvirus7_36 [Sylvanvirus sp.]
MSRQCKCKILPVSTNPLTVIQGSKNKWEIGPKIGAGGSATIYYARKQGDKEFCYAYGVRPNMEEKQIDALQQSSILGVTPALVDIISITPAKSYKKYDIAFISTAAERELTLPLSDKESKQIYNILEILATKGIDHGDTGNPSNWLKCGDQMYIIDFNFSDEYQPNQPVDVGWILDNIAFVDKKYDLEDLSVNFERFVGSMSTEQQILLSTLVKIVWGMNLPESNYLTQKLAVMLGPWIWILDRKYFFRV